MPDPKPDADVAADQAMAHWRMIARVRVGVAILVAMHALAHAVMPLRGVLESPPQTPGQAARARLEG